MALFSQISSLLKKTSGPGLLGELQLLVRLTDGSEIQIQIGIALSFEHCVHAFTTRIGRYCKFHQSEWWKPAGDM